MAKNRVSFGNIVKGKVQPDGTKLPNYVSIFRDMALQKGEYVNLETKQNRLDSLASALSTGKVTEDYAAKEQENISKMKDFVIAELVVYREREAKA